MGYQWLLWILGLQPSAGPTVDTRKPPAIVDLYLKQGADLSESLLWSSSGHLPDFTGATARWPIVVDEAGDVLGLTTTSSIYGGIALGTNASGKPGRISYQITKAATQVLCSARATHRLYIDWPNGTTTCLVRGTVYLVPGSPL